jgi:hypothetical protein
MNYVKRLQKSGEAIVIKDGALDKPIQKVRSRTGLPLQVVMLSELRKGDRFYEFMGLSSLPIRTAKTDAYIVDDDDGSKFWAVGIEPLTEAEKKRWGKRGCSLRSS